MYREIKIKERKGKEKNVQKGLKESSVFCNKGKVHGSGSQDSDFKGVADKKGRSLGFCNDFCILLLVN